MTSAGKVKPRQMLKKQIKKLALFIRRPLRVTCVDCGFLAFGNDEAHKQSQPSPAGQQRQIGNTWRDGGSPLSPLSMGQVRFDLLWPQRRRTT